MMTDDTHPELGVWVIDPRDEPHSILVEDHLARCPTCAEEATRLRAAASMLAVATPEDPPASLRDLVLTAALTQRPTRQRLIEPYSRQVDQLHALLSELDIGVLELPDPHYGSVNGVITHLAGNDGLVAADLGLATVDAGGAGTRRVREAWHGQAMRLLDGVEINAPLDRPVRMAGKGGLRRPLRDALVQRTFETWIHADDVRRVVRRPLVPPPPEDVSLIVALGLRLLPMAIRALGRERPGEWAALTLTGAVPDGWRVPLSMDSGEGADVARIRTDAVAFCELMASRQPVETLVYEVDGDEEAALDLLRAAATLGCD